jgi:hypothetical protein
MINYQGKHLQPLDDIEFRETKMNQTVLNKYDAAWIRENSKLNTFFGV